MMGVFGLSRALRPPPAARQTRPGPAAPAPDRRTAGVGGQAYGADSIGVQIEHPLRWVLKAVPRASLRPVLAASAVDLPA